MANDRTEKATPKHRQEARSEGRVARSQELGGWVAMVVGTVLIPGLVHRSAPLLSGLMSTAMLGQSGLPKTSTDMRVLGIGLTDMEVLAAPILLGMFILSLLIGFGQVGFGFSSKALKPKFDRVNPFKGIKKLFSSASWVELAKTLIKMSIAGLVSWHYLHIAMVTYVGSSPASLGAVAVGGAKAALGLIRSLAVAGLLVAVADYFIQRKRHEKSLKMSKQDVKDEYRQAEGDPKMKGQIRSRQMKISRMRMMAAVAGADVIAVNPTHFAVALRYDQGSGFAPRVVAKGSDSMAARIREEASVHGIPVVSDPPLARALFAACDLDAEIPASLYAAVAELLAFVYQLPSTARLNSSLSHRSAGVPVPS